jgi:recombination protein RecR
MRFPASIQNLIDEFSRLPTVGPKTAERFVFYLLNQNSADLKKFAEALAVLKDNITVCRSCFAISGSDPCPICADTKRDKNVLCLVADTRDQLAVESTGQYHGTYFILGGEINAIEGIGPDKLHIQPLLEKIKTAKPKEIIMALDPTIEGETTVLYLIKLLKPLGVKMTRLAKGLPMGADLEYVDELTLSNALKYRNEL